MMIRALLLATAAAGALHAQAPRPTLIEPSLSPDGRELVFASGGDLWTVPAAGGDARLLVSHPATEGRPLWSPDGTRLAFTSTRSGNGDIYVLTLASGALQRITFDDAPDVLGAWSRDGQWLWFHSSSRDIAGMNDVFRVPSGGGTPMIVAGDRYASEYWPAPSRDGRRVAITARGTTAAQWWRRGHSHLDESELWIVTLSGDVPTYTAVSRGGDGKDQWPMWSADEQSLFYVRDTAGVENLWQRGVAGGAPRRVTAFTSGRVLWPSISADGSAIVFERNFTIWRHDIASGQTREVPVTLRGAPAVADADRATVTTGASALAVSPDGRKVAFVARGEVWVTGAKEGGEAVRISANPGPDDEPVWLPDSRRLVYSSKRGDEWRLVRTDVVTREELVLTRGGVDVSPVRSHDGRRIAYHHNGRSLRVVGVDGTDDRELTTGHFGKPPLAGSGDIAWSPDDAWVAFLSTEDRGFTNAWVVPTAGGAKRAVSFLANAFAGSIVWSRDGQFLLYDTSQRTEATAIVRIDLVPRTPRFREDQFRDLFTTVPVRDTARPPAARDSTSRDSARTAPRPAPRTTIAFDGIRRRASVVLTGFSLGDLSPDGRTLLLVGQFAGPPALYIYSLDPLAAEPPAPRQLTTTPGGKSSVQYAADGREAWFTEAGRITSVVVETRAARTVSVRGEMDVDVAAERLAAFDEAWSYQRDGFYDPKMHGADWNAVRATFAPQVRGARTADEFRRLLNLMVGELNASHSGAGGPPSQPPSTGRIGARFARAAYEAGGRLVIADITPLSPLATATDARVGEVLVSVNGTRITRGMNLDSLLAHSIDRRTTLRLATPAGVERDVTLRPVNAATDKGLAYRQWVEERRAYVAQASNGRLGYVHLFDMGQGSLDQLFLDIDAENQGRDGIVVDVRNNNGGFVNAYALDVFARRPYLTMTRRDSPSAPARLQLGQRSFDRPAVLVVNQHSLSDAEDFTEGWRALKLGTVVGEPTSGWIIYTSGATLVDGTTLRMPFIRIQGADGADMELVPRPVDRLVVRPVGESYTARDSQLDAAVADLLARLR
ncbi:MAG: PD40 domain-containing protein [Gemmatimonadaceae bacterium]|nr:PD40 domain-containing protein [Gemmatimonadaceae bacterium]